MTPFHAIELAIELATRQRDALARKHEQAFRTVQKALQQLSQLENYAGDTDARWGQGDGGLSVEMLRHHYQFRDRLQHAVQLQQGNIAALQSQQQAAQQALAQAEARLAGLKHVLAQRMQVLEKQAQRREQREMDEFAAQRARQRATEYRLGELQ